LTEPEQPITPHIGWLWGGVGLALLGIVGGLTLVVLGVLQGDGPKRLATAEFPGSVSFDLDEKVERAVIYLEYPALGNVSEAPPHLSPSATRDGDDVLVDVSPEEGRVSGPLTEMEPIGSFTGTVGSYVVSVAPDSGGGSASIVVADPARSANGRSKVLVGSLGGVAAFLIGSMVAVTVGRRRTRSRQRLPVLVPPLQSSSIGSSAVRISRPAGVAAPEPMNGGAVTVMPAPSQPRDDAEA
jgi:hypothetical protein